MFASLPDKPDHDALEREILALWERESTFEQLRALNADGPRFSFFDGPVTANKSLAVHTAWGRTLKDVFQRYKALRGHHQRYQNGFDCQGLWIEVGVERELGLNSKREIEEYGLAEFARKCRDVVVRSSQDLTQGLDPARPVDGLGEGLLHVLRHEHRVHLALPPDRPRAWLARDGPPLDRVVPPLRHLDLRTRAARALRGPARPLALRPLPAARPRERVDRGVDDDAVDAAGERRRRRQPRGRLRPARERRVGGRARCSPTSAFTRVVKGAELVGLRYGGPFDTLAPGAAVEHRVIPWADVALDTGTGIVHIAPGCGGEDFELSKELGLDVLTPVDEGGRFYPEYGWLHGVSTMEATEQIVGDLGDRGLLVRSETIEHSYPVLLALPHAADLPALRRLVHRGRRAAAAAARGERHRRVDARLHGQAHGRLAAQHGRLEHLAPALLRAAAAVLPLLLRPPQRDRVAGRAGGAGARGPRPARGAAAPLDRRRADRLRGLRRARHAGRGGRRRLARRRHRAVLDPGLAARGVRRRRATPPAPRRG